MAKFTFTAESDDLAEIAMLVDRMVAGGMDTPAAPVRGSTAEQATRPAPEPEVKATRTRKPKAEEVAPATEGEPATGATAPQENTSASDAPAATATTETPSQPQAEAVHPLLAEVTLQDIKDKASEVMKKDPKSGAAIMAKLKERFGVNAFSQVAAEDRARCMAMLEEF